MVDSTPTSPARSIDPVSGANQNTNTYWRRIKSAFEERKLLDPYFTTIYMQRGEKAMSNTCFAMYVADTCSSAVQMVRMFTMYRQDSSDQEFKFLHVFSRIESCEK